MKLLQTLLYKVDKLLTTEPARVIGYGAAVVVYLVARVLAARGYIDLPMTFEQSIGAAFAAISTLVIVIESIRRFVYSPQTYIEELSDEWQNGHDAAHAEEDLRQWLDAVRAQHAEEQKQVVSVGSTRAKGATDKTN